ncbi:MAG: alpha/beta fold hydrolase [Flavobacteriales bacterium]
MSIQNIHYVIEGKGIPVVLLHGFLEDITMWDEFSTKLITQHTIIRIDLLGHGKTISQGAVYSMEEQAKLVKSVLDQEQISEVIIIGHSMGGYITLAFAEQYPQMVKGFSLFFSSATEDSSKKKEQRNRLVELVKKQRQSFIQTAIPNLFHNPDKKLLQPFVEKTKKMAKNVTTENIVASLYGMRSRKDRTSVLQTSIPKQLLMGRFDTALDRKSLEKQINTAYNLEYKIFDTGHMGHYEAPKETFTEVNTFIKNVVSHWHFTFFYIIRLELISIIWQ